MRNVNNSQNQKVISKYRWLEIINLTRLLQMTLWFFFYEIQGFYFD